VEGNLIARLYIKTQSTSCSSTHITLLTDAGFVSIQTAESLYTDTGRTLCPDCGVWPNDDRECECDGTDWSKDL